MMTGMRLNLVGPTGGKKEMVQGNITPGPQSHIYIFQSLLSHRAANTAQQVIFPHLSSDINLTFKPDHNLQASEYMRATLEKYAQILCMNVQVQIKHKVSVYSENCFIIYDKKQISHLNTCILSLCLH